MCGDVCSLCTDSFSERLAGSTTSSYGTLGCEAAYGVFVYVDINEATRQEKIHNGTPVHEKLCLCNRACRGLAGFRMC